jgi:hypothetical protein
MDEWVDGSMDGGKIDGIMNGWIYNYSFPIG